jgi:uncharacterized Zn-finger protein
MYFRAGVKSEENVSQDLSDQSGIHAEEETFGCSFCEKSFSNPSAARRHLRIHTSVKAFRLDGTFKFKRL